MNINIEKGNFEVRGWISTLIMDCWIKRIGINM
jgi:hypothetical protein